MRRLLFLLLLATPLFAQNKPVVAVTAQTANYTDSTGQVWTPGQSKCATPGGNYPSGATISGALPAASDSKLYNAEVYGPQTCTYTGLANGTYTLLFKFAELWYGNPAGNGGCTGTSNCAAGKRIFNVSANNTAVLTNFDIAAAAGGALKAVDRSFTVNVTAGTLSVAFTSSAGSPDTNPKWDSISITAGTAVVTPPSISTQPTNQTVNAGSPAAFSVVANGSTPLSYQWQKGGANIAGATSATYTTPATVASDTGSTFDVIVKNSAGTVQSNTVTLTVQTSTTPVSSMILTGTSPSGQPVTAAFDPTKPINVTATLSGSFTINGTAVPQSITSVTPSTGTAGTILTIVGTGFIQAGAGGFLTCPAAAQGLPTTNYPFTSTVWNSSTQITATVPTVAVPSGATSVNCDVTVTP